MNSQSTQQSFSKNLKTSPATTNTNTGLLSGSTDEKHGLRAPCLLLTCMDFRLRSHIQQFMEMKAGKNSYDEIVLPGASLAVINEHYPHWGTTFEDVLKLAIDLHGVTTLIMMDHRECGAYKLFNNTTCLNSYTGETEVHARVLGNVKKYLQKTYPALQIETFLMDISGQVETILVNQ